MEVIASYKPENHFIVIVGTPSEFAKLGDQLIQCQNICMINLGTQMANSEVYAKLIRSYGIRVQVWEKNLLEIHVEQGEILISGNKNELSVLSSRISDLGNTVLETGFNSHFHIEYYGGVLKTISSQTRSTIFECHATGLVGGKS